MPAAFQKGFEAVTVDCSLNADGSVKVVNRGLKGGLGGKLKQSTGKAKVADPTTNAKLRFSFFAPFYGITGSSIMATTMNGQSSVSPRRAICGSLPALKSLRRSCCVVWSSA